MRSNGDLFSIGEFSRMTHLSVKTLRFYHEKGLLIPAVVEGQTGYRSYDLGNLEVARVIVALRGLDFSLATIGEILQGFGDDGNILEFLEQQRDQLRADIQRHRDIVKTLDAIITQERDARDIMNQNKHQIEQKQLPAILVGGIRTRGRYADCSKVFRQLGRKLGRHIGGKAMMLCYDQEFKEDDADFEPCMPLKRQVEVEGVEVREIPGGDCISLIHTGPYENLTRTYCQLIEHAAAKGLKLQSPSREVYIKGPGIIFKGNPKNYLTEIQFLLER